MLILRNLFMVLVCLKSAEIGIEILAKTANHVYHPKKNGVVTLFQEIEDKECKIKFITVRAHKML